MQENVEKGEQKPTEEQPAKQEGDGGTKEGEAVQEMEKEAGGQENCTVIPIQLSCTLYLSYSLYLQRQKQRRRQQKEMKRRRRRRRRRRKDWARQL